MKYIIDIPEDKIDIDFIRSLFEPTIKMMPYDESAAEQRGREEAWELIKAIGKMSDDDMVDCFGTRVIVNLSYTEAYEKYVSWKKQKDEIKVGDEVAFHNDDGRPDTVVVVTYVGEDGFIDGMDRKGIQCAHKNHKRWTKTGRHFSEIADLLEKMRESE